MKTGILAFFMGILFWIGILGFIYNFFTQLSRLAIGIVFLFMIIISYITWLKLTRRN